MYLCIYCTTKGYAAKNQAKYEHTSTYKTHAYTSMTQTYDKETSRYFSLYLHVYAGMCVYLPVFHVFDEKGFFNKKDI